MSDTIIFYLVNPITGRRTKHQIEKNEPIISAIIDSCNFDSSFEILYRGRPVELHRSPNDLNMQNNDVVVNRDKLTL